MCTQKPSLSLCAFCVCLDPSTMDSQKLSVSAVPQPKHIPFWVSHTIPLFSAVYLLSERENSENNSWQLQQADLASNGKRAKEEETPLPCSLSGCDLCPFHLNLEKFTTPYTRVHSRLAPPTVLHGKYCFCLSLTSKRDCFPFKQYRA